MRDHKTLEAWIEVHRVVMTALDFATLHWHPSLRSVYDQLTAAALSVQLNIAEGYGLGTKPLFLRHLRIAYGSSIETGDLLELLCERRVISEPDGNEVLEHCKRCQRLLLGLIRKYQPPAHR